MIKLLRSRPTLSAVGAVTVDMGTTLEVSRAVVEDMEDMDEAGGAEEIADTVVTVEETADLVGSVATVVTVVDSVDSVDKCTIALIQNSYNTMLKFY